MPDPNKPADSTNAQPSDKDANLSLTDILNQGLLTIVPDDDTDEGNNKDDADPDEGGTKDDDGTKSPSPKSKPAYKSIEDAEKAAQEAKRKMHEATTEAAKLRKQLEDYAMGKTPPAKPSEPDPYEAIAKDTKAKVDAIKSDDPDYNAKVLEIIQAQTAAIAKLENKKARDEEISRQQRVKVISSRLVDEGLGDFEDEFWALAPSVPASIKSFDDAVDWGVSELKKLIEKINSRVAKDAAGKDDKSKKGFVPGKGIKPPPKPKDDDDTAPKSVADAIRELRKSRIVK